MSQIALRLVRSDGTTCSGPAHAPRDPRDLSDEDLLEHFLPDAHAIIDAAGGFRAALELPIEQLAHFPSITAERHADIGYALELGRRFVEASINRGEFLTSPAATRRALMARLRERPHEIFICIFLTNRHQVISIEEMFRGTIDGASVHPREVAKRALELNAAALVVAHNHPSGVADPSRADIAITTRLVDALRTIDVRLLDHFIIGDGATVSFAEHGWI